MYLADGRYQPGNIRIVQIVGTGFEPDQFTFMEGFSDRANPILVADFVQIKGESAAANGDLFSK